MVKPKWVNIFWEEFWIILVLKWSQRKSLGSNWSWKLICQLPRELIFLILWPSHNNWSLQVKITFKRTIKIKFENYLATVSTSVFISSTEEIILVNNFFSFGCFEPILACFGRDNLNCNFLKHWRCCCYTMFCSAPAYNISIFSNKILPIFLEKNILTYRNVNLDHFEEFTRSINQLG